MVRSLERVKLVDVDLTNTTFCARIEFTDEEIQSLADSIEEIGLRNPPGYIREGRRLIVNYGWRRTYAVHKLGWEEIEAFVYTSSDDKELHLQNLSDNLDRDDLSVLELAGKVKVLRELEIPVEEISTRLSKGTQHIYDLLKLTTMPEKIRMATHRGEISLYQAIEIFKFKDSKYLEILQQTKDEKLSVGALKRMRRGDLAPSISEETQGTLRRIIAEAAEKGTEITYEELVQQIRPPEEGDTTISSGRVWKSHLGWSVVIPYDWVARHEEKYGGKIREVAIEELEDGTLVVRRKEEIVDDPI